MIGRQATCVTCRIPVRVPAHAVGKLQSHGGWACLGCCGMSRKWAIAAAREWRQAGVQ